MEYADNGDLYQKIISYKKKSIFFEESEIWKIFIQLVKGLKSLHDLKILHRDLKSANVFLFKDNNIKLGDLNVSKVLKKGLSYTQTGTPYYASPEVWKDLPYDNKSDIWSLGCVLYEIITLKPPFRAENMEGLYSKVIKGNFSKIPNIFSNDIYSVVKSLIQINPECRPSCDQILKNPIVVKRIEYFSAFDEGLWSQDEFFDNKELLRTIKIPKNLLFLSNKLPKPNYISCININVGKKKYNRFNKGKIIEDKIPPVNICKKEKEKNYDKEIVDNNYFDEKNFDNEDEDNEKSNDDDNDYIRRDDSSELKRSNNNINNIICNRNKGVIEDINDLPKLKYINSKKENKKIKYMNKNNSHGHLEELYKIYAPYLNKPEIMYNKYKLGRIKYNNNNNYDYIKNLEKYYDKIHNYKYNHNDLIRENSNSHRIGPEYKVIPKRKLSPIRRNLINIY